jgi:hypothetical protein
VALAINTVECASIDVRSGEELPWYKSARAALAAPCPCEQLRADLAEALEALKALDWVMPDYRNEVAAAGRAAAVLEKHNATPPQSSAEGDGLDKASGPGDFVG